MVDASTKDNIADSPNNEEFNRLQSAKFLNEIKTSMGIVTTIADEYEGAEDLEVSEQIS